VKLTKEQTEIYAKLEAAGFYVGARNPLLNQAFSGQFMVADLNEWDGKASESAADGPPCIVGDDLANLIDDAASWLADDSPPLRTVYDILFQEYVAVSGGEPDSDMDSALQTIGRYMDQNLAIEQFHRELKFMADVFTRAANELGDV